MEINKFCLIIIGFICVLFAICVFLDVFEILKRETVFCLLAIIGVISIFFTVVASKSLESTKNIDTYNISITNIQETDEKERNNEVIKYNDDSGNENKVAINETKYDADTTYVEMKRYKWLFIYENKNILHIKAN